MTTCEVMRNTTG